MRFEIVNPSDNCTLESDSLEAAAVACVYLGRGAYGLREIDGARRVPIFLLGGLEEWFLDEFGACFGECVKRNLGKVADALESVRYESGRRTSMNNIGAAAEVLARTFRAKAKELELTPDPQD